jgi:mono/diheme cytochrome c family protein
MIDDINSLIHHPNAAMRSKGMPPAPLSAQQTGALWAYLDSMPEPAHRAPGVPAPTAFRVAEVARHPAGAPAPSRASATPSAIPAQTGPKAFRSQPITHSAPSQAQVSGASLSVNIAAGHKVFQQHVCMTCHGPAAQGTAIGPPLAGISRYLSESTFSSLVHHPNPAMAAKGMPPTPLAEAQTRDLWDYLNSMPVPAHRAPGVPPVAVFETSETNSPPVPAPTASAPPAPTAPAAATAPEAAATQAKAAPAQLSGQALQGEQIFTSHGCIACHGVNGVGTPLAVSLIGVTNKYSHQQLADLIRHPNARMKAGGMPTFSFTDPEIENLVAYLAQLRKPSSATATGAEEASPARHAPPPKLTAEEQKGREIYFQARCSTCHGDGGMEGTAAAPSLTATASELPPDMIQHLLEHPSNAMQSHGMPPVSLNPTDLKALISYIRALRYNR